MFWEVCYCLACATGIDQKLFVMESVVSAMLMLKKGIVAFVLLLLRVFVAAKEEDNVWGSATALVFLTSFVF